MAIMNLLIAKKLNEIFGYTDFQIPPFAVYETIKQAFGGKLGEQDVLVAAKSQRRIAETEAQLKTK